MRGLRVSTLAVTLATVLGAACAAGRETVSGIEDAPIVQPGAPGESSRVITAGRAVNMPRVQHTAADVRFTHNMLVHHAQALEMTALRAERSTSEDLRLLALRIELSQRDEITMMEDWLKARGESLPDVHGHHQGVAMPGMLTADELNQLAQAGGDAFDRLFLELMIKHHQGALVTVDELFATAGAGQEPEVFAFASDVVDDQRIEIDRMVSMLKERQK